MSSFLKNTLKRSTENESGHNRRTATEVEQQNPGSKTETRFSDGNCYNIQEPTTS